MIVIFDLDGTLLDTYELIRESFIHVFQTHMPNYPYTEEEIQSFFGPVLEDSFATLTKDQNEILKMVDTYRHFNIENHDKFLKTFSGAKEVIERLKQEGYKLAIYSNKRRDAIFRGLDLVGLTPYFEFVVSSDDVKNVKPHPEGVLQILSFFKSNNAIMVGDTTYDIKAAKAANILAMGVTWSFYTKEVLLESGADKIADSFEDVYRKIIEVNRHV